MSFFIQYILVSLYYMETKTQYIAVANYEGKDKLYFLSKSKFKTFESLFGRFEGEWADHNGAVQWIKDNGRLVGTCTCVTFS